MLGKLGGDTKYNRRLTRSCVFQSPSSVGAMAPERRRQASLWTSRTADQVESLNILSPDKLSHHDLRH